MTIVTDEVPTRGEFHLREFIAVALLTSIWIHITEVLRAVLVALPRIKEFFDNQAGIAELNVSTGIVWGVWDFLLTFILVFVVWLCTSAFGHSIKTCFIAGSVVCAATLGIFWIALVNIGLGEWSTAAIAVSLAWVELVIGAWIASQLFQRPSATQTKPRKASSSRR